MKICLNLLIIYTFFPFPLTHKHVVVYRDVYRLFLIDLLVITRLIADEIYPHSGLVFNDILMDLIYLKFELIDFSAISNWQSVDLNPCIKNRTVNSKESEDGYKETTEIKGNYQQKNRRDSQSIVLVMTKTSNIRYL